MAFISEALPGAVFLDLQVFFQGSLQPVTYMWEQLEGLGLLAKEVREATTNPDGDKPACLGLLDIVL